MGDPSSLAATFSDAILRGKLAVPVYPAAAMRLRRLIADERASVAQACDVVASDPALAATVLRLANSAMYRPDGASITSLGRAIHRIGLRSLGAVATAAGIGAQACGRGPLLGIKFSVWRRSVATALICQKLAPLRGLDGEDAFLAGLLHGFARTVGVACLETMLGSAGATSAMAEEKWWSLLEQHRGVIAKTVAERWELPQELAQAVSEGPESDNQLSRLLALGDQVAQAFEQNVPIESMKLNERELTCLQALSTVLPDAIAALMEEPDAKRPPPPSSVMRPATALKGALREAHVKITDARSKGAATLVASAISADGLRFFSPRLFQEGSMAHFTIDSAGAPFKVWVSILLCAPENGGFAVEAQLFAPSRDLRADWQRLWQGNAS